MAGRADTWARPATSGSSRYGARSALDSIFLRLFRSRVVYSMSFSQGLRPLRMPKSETKGALE